VGDVDYRLLTKFVRARRENADERAGKNDVEDLLKLLEQRARPADAERRRPKPVRQKPERQEPQHS